MNKRFELIQGGLGNGGKTKNPPKRMSFIDSMLESLYLGLAFNLNFSGRLSVLAVAKLEVLHRKYGWPGVSDFFKLLATSDEKEE